jgi:hypothetical protein
MTRAMTVGALLAAGLSASAQASFYTWSWDRRETLNNFSAGRPGAMTSTYDSESKVFTWDVIFANGVARDTDGYWLVVNDGPDPKNRSRRHAIIYFDATDLANPEVSVYRYNGRNDAESYDTPGKLLASTRGAARSEIVASAREEGNARIFSLRIDASRLNQFYAGRSDFANWEGIRFDENIGVWFHPVSGAEFDYDTRRLTNLDGGSGWIDGSNLTTSVIPAPGLAGLLAAAGLAAVRRRRS